MEYKFAFEKLDVWNQSKELVKKVYELTDKFPRKEMFGLVSQINRAALSISANIAEGSSRRSVKDQGHFYTMAYSSTMELISHLIISNEIGFIKNSDEFVLLKELSREISNKINSLHRALNLDN